MPRTIQLALVAALVAVVALVGTAVAQTAQRFGDVPTDASYYDAVEWAAVNGMVTGCGDGNFCPDRTLTRAEYATLRHGESTATFSGIGDEVTDDIILEPGYYSLRIQFFPKAGYDWDDSKEHDFYARFESKADGITLVEGDWKGHWPADVEDNPDKVSNKHSDVWRSHHFRVDEPGAHWFDIETSGKIAWLADVYRKATQPGASGFTTDDDEDSSDD